MANSELDPSRLEALLESARLLQSSLDLSPLLKHLLRASMGRLLATRGMIAVRERDGQLRIAMQRGGAPDRSGQPYVAAEVQAAGFDRIFPIGDREQPIGYLALGGLLNGQKAEEERAFLEALAGIAASVITNALSHAEEQATHRKLDLRVQELRALLDLGRGLSATLDPEEVLQLALLTLAGRFGATRYAAFAWRSGHPLVAKAKGLLLEPEPLQKGQSAVPPGCLEIPIQSQEERMGVMVMGPRLSGRPYSEADLEFGSGLAAQVAVALGNAWNFREAVTKRELEREMSLAAQIQVDLFPASLPTIAGYQVHAMNRQARQVGGDYYDVLQGDPARPLFCVADISGKGLPAALLMANIQATLRALRGTGMCLAELAEKANALLHASTPANRYATAILVSLNPETGEAEYVNCGHNPGLVLRASGRVELLEPSGIALGLFPRMPYTSARFTLHPGDQLALYTDGVTEAQCEAGEEWGIEAFVQTLQQQSALPLVEQANAAIAEIDAFTGTAPQFDDITILLVRRNPG